MLWLCIFKRVLPSQRNDCMTQTHNSELDILEQGSHLLCYLISQALGLVVFFFLLLLRYRKFRGIDWGGGGNVWRLTLSPSHPYYHAAHFWGVPFMLCCTWGELSWVLPFQIISVLHCPEPGLRGMLSSGETPLNWYWGATDSWHPLLRNQTTHTLGLPFLSC